MDRQSFIHYVEENQERLRRYLVALCCGDVQMAEDIAQDAFMKAYLASDTFHDEGSFTAWIFRIAYTTFVSRRRSWHPTADLDAADDVSATSPGDYQPLYAALDRLSEKERSAILLYYIQGYNAREIGGIIGAGEEAVRQLLSRGRKHLRNILRLYGEDR